MGSTGVHMERGEKIADVVLRDLSSKYEVLKHVGRRTSGEWQGAIYTAIRDRETGVVSCLVILWHRNPSPSVWWNLTYKYVHEDSGPYESDCPASILDLLTWEGNAFSTEWRARCRANLTRDAVKVGHGSTVKFAHTLLFGDKVEEDTFVFMERTTFRRVSDQRLVRIPNWRKNYAFEVTAVAA